MNHKTKVMEKQDRKNRIIARGEITGHSHIIVGDADVKTSGDEIYVTVHGKAAIRHLLETPWVEEGREVFTEEHADIDLELGEYKIVPQVEFDPYEEVIRRVQD